jgi:hypothetical protein
MARSLHGLCTQDKKVKSRLVERQNGQSFHFAQADKTHSGFLRTEHADELRMWCCSLSPVWTHRGHELEIGEIRHDANCRKTQMSPVEEEPLLLQKSMQSHCSRAGRFSSCQSTMLQRVVSFRFICCHNHWYGREEESSPRRKFGIARVLREACKWRRRERPPEFFSPSCMGMVASESAFVMSIQSLRPERSAREQKPSS